MTTERAKIERLRSFMQRRKLLFVKVGAYAHEDRVIETTIEKDGIMRRSPEYSLLLKQIVDLLS